MAESYVTLSEAAELEGINYRKTDILKPSEDMLLEQDKVIMAGDINVSVRNVAQSSREKE